MLLDSGCVICGSYPGPVCRHCEAQLIVSSELRVDELDGCRIGFVLDPRCRTVIAALKYRRQRRLARWLAHRLAHLVPLAADLITWVPATPSRRRIRGFDQSEELARELSRSTGIPSRKQLQRSRTDERQTGRGRTDRERGPALVAIRRSPPVVILVDDVVTTGSSMTSAAARLRSVGAQRVTGLAIAQVPSPGDNLLPPHADGSSIRRWM